MLLNDYHSLPSYCYIARTELNCLDVAVPGPSERDSLLPLLLLLLLPGLHPPPPRQTRQPTINNHFLNFFFLEN